MTNQEIKLQKMEKSYEVTKKVLSVLRVITIVIAAILMLAGCVLCGMQKTLDPMVSEAIESGMVTINVAEMKIGGALNFTATFDKMLDNGQFSLAIGILSIIAVVVLVFIVIAMSLFIKIFTLINKNGTPFCEEVTETLKGVFIFTAIVIFLVNGIVSGLVMALVFWCIYRIFEYGSTLQTESDETL